MKFVPQLVQKTYTEIGQPNPLRWIICNDDKKGNAVQVSNIIRCKDFFNDLTYTIQTGKGFSIYGFNAKEYSPPKKGEPVVFAVKFLFPEFFSNMEVLNSWLVNEQGFPAIDVLQQPDKTTAVLKIPGKYFENTYFTSLVTLLIRLMNNQIKFKNFEEVTKYDFHVQEMALFKQVLATKWFFKNFPKTGYKYVWYQGEDYNSEVENSKPSPYGVSSMVHNNGLVSWSNSGIK